MIVTGVRLRPRGSSDFVEMTYRNATRKNPYNVKNVIGLDADTIVPRFYGRSGGEKFNNLSLEKRDVVIRVGLNPQNDLGQSYSELRDSFYRKISQSRSGLIDIEFLNGTAVSAKTYGFVSKFEASHFTETPEIQVTITCEDAMLRGVDQINLDVLPLEPQLTVLHDDISTAPHGVKFRFRFIKNVAEFQLTYPGTELRLIVTEQFVTNDILCISTEFFDKHIHIHRAGSEIHVADKILSEAIWPVIFPGENRFAVQDHESVVWDAIWYRHAFWGV